MFIIVVELVIAAITFGLYKVIKRLSASENLTVSNWVSALKTPIVTLLCYSWVFLSVSILPWKFYFENFYIAMYQVSTKQAAAATKLQVETFFYYGKIFFAAGYTILLAWLVMTIINKWEEGLHKKSTLVSNDLHRNVDSMFMFIRGAVYVVVGFILMKVLDLNNLADSIFQTGAVGALFVSFAARDSIANVFGGFMILFDRPFRVGDYISSPDRDIEGIVERIGWRVTQVRTPKKSIKYIPNCTFSTVSIENISRMSNRRIRMTIGVRYDDLKKLESICNQLEEMVMTLEFVDKRMGHFCTFSELGEYSVNVLVVVYTRPLSYREYNKSKDHVLHKIVKIVQANGADFPFPTRTLNASGIVNKLKKTMND